MQEEHMPTEDTSTAEEVETTSAELSPSPSAPEIPSLPADAMSDASESLEEEAPVETPPPSATEAVVETAAPEVPAVTDEAPSEPQPQEEQTAPQRPKLKLTELEPGTEWTGRVVGIAEFGAFVDIGAETDGLVHISELSEGRVDKVSDVVAIGDEVQVWIKDVDVEQQRISLSMRPKPKYRLQDLRRGMVVDGIVTGVRDYGIFVDIGAETEGLVHVSEMAEEFVNNPSELVSPGETVQVRIKKVDRKRRRISLTMKGLRSRPAPPPPKPKREEPMPSVIELALREALEALEEEMEGEELPSPEETTRDELSEIFARMLREYREQKQAEESSETGL